MKAPHRPLTSDLSGPRLLQFFSLSHLEASLARSCAHLCMSSHCTWTVGIHWLITWRTPCAAATGPSSSLRSCPCPGVRRGTSGQSCSCEGCSRGTCQWSGAQSPSWTPFATPFESSVAWCSIRHRVGPPSDCNWILQSAVSTCEESIPLSKASSEVCCLGLLLAPQLSLHCWRSLLTLI